MIIPIPLLIITILVLLLLVSVLIYGLITMPFTIPVKIWGVVVSLLLLAFCMNLSTIQVIARNQEQPIKVVKKVDLTYNPDYPDYIIVFRLSEDKLGRNQLYKAEILDHSAEYYSEGKTYYKTLYDMFRFSDIKRIIIKE
jgi:hypothetical protein